MRFLFVPLVYFILAFPANAATIYIDPAKPTIYRGDSITMSVRLMPDHDSGECVNAVDAVISYTDNIIPVDVSIGKSIVPVWVEAPRIDTEKKQITFAGGIPNGYCGRIQGDPRLTNVIAEIVFRSPGLQIGGGDNNTATVQFTDQTQVFLNDGFGTLASLVKYGSELRLEKTPGAEIKDDWREVVQADNLPPESFSIELAKDENGINFNGKYFIVFNTTDKQSGLSHYEIMEEPVKNLGSFSWGGTGVPWIKDNSPYELSDQSLNSIIYVKAVDKSGNEYIAKFIPEETMRTVSSDTIITYVIWAAAGLVLLVLAGMFIFKLRRKFSKKLEVETNETENEKD